MSHLVVTITNPSQEPANRWLTRPRFVAFISAAIVVQVMLAIVFALKPCGCKNNDTNKSWNSSSAAAGFHSDPSGTKIILDGGVPKELSCKWPVMTSVKVKSVFPSVSAVYAPPCVTLHRCGVETGCCSSAVSTCVAKSEKNVTLPIRIIELGAGMVMHRRIENLTFTNHTECVCTDQK